MAACFDLNGMMSPLLSELADQPIPWGAAVAVATLLTYAYGTMSCAASVLSFQSS